MTFRKFSEINIDAPIILGFIIFIIIGSHYGNIKQAKYQEEFKKSEFTGIITKKYRQKGGELLFYKDLKTGTEIEISPSDTLAVTANISDTIMKLSNLNECIIKNSKKKIRIVCIHE